MPSPPEESIQSQRPVEFRSTSEEVAAGVLVGGLIGATSALFFGALVGLGGYQIGEACGGWGVVGGAVVVWLLYWIAPVYLLLPLMPWWRFALVLLGGTVYLVAMQWHIQNRDIGDLYRWILTALPFGIVLGTIFEPLRLAEGGDTKFYAERSLMVTSYSVAYGNNKEYLLAIAAIIGAIAQIASAGSERIAAALSGLVAGALIALGPSALLSWRGDVAVADLFFGSAWNIAWACTVISATAGAVGGYVSAVRHEEQSYRHESLGQPVV